jgi:peroxiredoxin
MQLQSGMVAPDFQRNDLFEQPIKLTNYQGRILLLSFFRNAACAICNLRVHHLIQRYPTYQQLGLDIVVFFESSAEALLTYVAKQDAPFPIIPDPTADMYAHYGVEVSQPKVTATMEMPTTNEVVAEAAAQGFALTPEPGSNFFRMPADFLIGPDGRVIQAHYAEYIWDHMPFEVIDELLAQVTPSVG